jgi:hypothetical protein
MTLLINIILSYFEFTFQIHSLRELAPLSWRAKRVWCEQPISCAHSQCAYVTGRQTASRRHFTCRHHRCVCFYFKHTKCFLDRARKRLSELFVCPEGHVIHTFLSCDQQAQCAPLHTNGRCPFGAFQLCGTKHAAPSVTMTFPTAHSDNLCQ